MTTVWGKKLYIESVACVCFTFDTIFLNFAFFMTIGYLMGVMTISFALTIDLIKILWSSENGWLTNVFFEKLPVKLPWPSEINLHFS